MNVGPSGAVTVRAVLQDPRWRDRLDAVAGEAQFDRKLASVQVLDSLTADRGIEPGAAVVLITPVGTTDWRIDVLVRRAASAGAAALVLPADASGTSGFRQLAERLGQPVLAWAGPPFDLAVDLQVALTSPETETVRMILAAHRSLAGEVGTIDDVLATASDLVGEPVEFTPEAADIAMPMDGRTIIEQPVGRGRHGGDARVWTVVRDPTPDRAAAVRDALTVVAGTLERVLAQRSVEVERNARVRSSLLADVLESGEIPTPELRRRAREADWPLVGSHTGIRLQLLRPGDVLRMTPAVGSALDAEGLAPVLVEQDEGWSGWLTSSREPSVGRSREVAAALRAAQRRLAPHIELAVGVGRPQTGIRGIAASMAEAADAARLAATHPERGRFFQIDQLGLAQLLLAWVRTESFQPAARTMLEPLEAGRGELVRTLGAYLDSGCSLLETAAVLGVHRNTVATRVERIQQQLAVDLADADQRLALHLACRALHVS